MRGRKDREGGGVRSEAGPRINANGMGDGGCEIWAETYPSVPSAFCLSAFVPMSLIDDFQPNV